MKMKMKTNLRATLILALSFAVLATSCNKDKGGTPLPDLARISFLNAGTAADSLNFFIDTQKVNNKPLAYRDTFLYKNVWAGNRSIELKSKSNQSLFKKSLTVEKNKSYSLFAVNASEAGAAELLQVTDNLTAPADNKAKIRFVNLTAGTDKLDFTTSDDVKLAENVAYKSAADFKELDAKKTSFKIVNAGDKSVLLELKDVQLDNGRIYTVWLTGVKNATDDKMKPKANLFINK